MKKETTPDSVIDFLGGSEMEMPDYMQLAEVMFNDYVDNAAKYISDHKDYNFIKIYNDITAVSDLCVATKAYEMFSLHRVKLVKDLENVHLLSIAVMDRPMAVFSICIEAVANLENPIEQAASIVLWFPIIKHFANKSKIFYDQTHKEEVANEENK